ncbi:Vacuolar sorting protein 18 [Camellia lanceoleosa]|uniref:Vacuolar sorting protein 18 n=1 Tax=Camellia lanceoleosa TaxID=1840588 RepID=A0ACC0GS36_9ERIC|nr:Vacuolar sorting protein 18 [Camellia lanceoleosa]
MMSMHEEAVALALQETDGLLKIEDILPFFPDFALIDDFKEAICSSLEDYNKQIEQLKQEMNDATCGADNIRNDISALPQRYAVIDCDEDCGVCQKKILTASWDHRMARGYTSVGAMAPFYVFPCGHAFHAQCLIAHVIRCTHRDQAEYILDLQKQLTLLGGESRKDSNDVTFDHLIASWQLVSWLAEIMDWLANKQMLVLQPQLLALPLDSQVLGDVDPTHPSIISHAQLMWMRRRMMMMTERRLDHSDASPESLPM